MSLKASLEAWWRIHDNFESLSSPRASYSESKKGSWLLVLMNHQYAAKKWFNIEKSSYLLQEMKCCSEQHPSCSLCCTCGSGLQDGEQLLDSLGLLYILLYVAFVNSLYSSPLGVVHHELGGKIVRWCEARIKERILRKLVWKLPGFMVH